LTLLALPGRSKFRKFALSNQEPEERDRVPFNGIEGAIGRTAWPSVRRGGPWPLRPDQLFTSA